MALLKGYSSVPGSARRVRAPDGEVLSHRQYRNRVVRKEGWKSLSELENDQGWKSFRYKIRENNPKANVTYNSKLVGDYAKVKKEREKNPPQRVGNRWKRNRKLEPVGRDMKRTPLGRLLIAMGAVDDSDMWGQYA
jgi:hypothetical protein